MAAVTTTTFANFLKILYPSGPEYLWYENSPVCEWMPKSTDFTNDTAQINPVVGGIRGAVTASLASSTKSTPTHYKFNVPRVKDYVFGSLEEEAIMASEGNPKAIAKALDVSIRSAMYEFGRSQSRHIWGTGGGALGQVGSVSTTVVTLSDVSDVVHFELGMEVESSETDGTSGALQANSATITAIDRTLGTLTTDSNWTAQMAALDADDYLFREGDFGNVCTGIQKWVPQLSSNVTTLHGVNRALDVNRLGGNRVAGSGKDMESIIFDGVAEASINSGRVDTLWMGSKRYAELCKSIHSKATYEMASSSKDKAKFGFSGFTLPGERGPITVYSDPNCPHAYGLLTRRSAWELKSLGKLPHFAGKDGLKFLRESASDSVEYRLKGYFNLLCTRPLDNVAIGWDLTSVA